MARFGERKSKIAGRAYSSDPIREYAESFLNTAKGVMNESGFSYFANPQQALMDPSVKASLRKFFVENSADTAHMKAYQIEEHEEDMNALFENDISMMESATSMSFNPMVGMALPMHKNIMMNMVFDKGAIPKSIAESPKFTRTMEFRYLIKPDGTKIDMFSQQGLMAAAMRSVNPWVKVDVDLNYTGAQTGATTIVQANLGGTNGTDHIDVESYIGAIKLNNVYFAVGDLDTNAEGIVEDGNALITVATTKDAWYRCDMHFTPGYNEVKRTLTARISGLKVRTGAATDVTVEDTIVGFFENDAFTIMKSNATSLIESVRLMVKLDASSRTIDVCHVGWDEVTKLVEIGTDEGINTSISPEEVKDISVLYNVNQVTKVMSLMKTAMAERKDAEIKDALDLSFKRLPKKSKFQGQFDFAPREGYAGDQESYKKATFLPFFDRQITKMLYVLNDPNMAISVFGDPDIVRMITPTEYTFQTPSAIGPVEIDFSKTVVTSDKRTYQFIGSDRLRNTEELILILCPKNTDRIVYAIYDYQMYISNEIRQNSNPSLPNIWAFERWKFDSYQPVQGRLQILNPTGLRSTDNGTIEF